MWEDAELVNRGTASTPSPSPATLGKKSDLESFVETAMLALTPGEQASMRALVEDALQGRRLKLMTLCSWTDGVVPTLEATRNLQVWCIKLAAAAAFEVLRKIDSRIIYKLASSTCATATATCCWQVIFQEALAAFPPVLLPSAESMSIPQKLQGDIVKHVLSCDCDPLVEKFIKGVARPEFFVRQLDDMRDSVVLDAWSGKHVPRPAATSTCCGWVCHTGLCLSRLLCSRRVLSVLSLRISRCSGRGGIPNDPRRASQNALAARAQASMPLSSTSGQRDLSTGMAKWLLSYHKENTLQALVFQRPCHYVVSAQPSFITAHIQTCEVLGNAWTERPRRHGG